MDTVSPKKRSWIMSRIRSKGTKPEFAVKAILKAAKFPFSEYVDDLPGRPDFVLPFGRTAVFVHGCFFHGCPEHCKFPKSNTAFWTHKIFHNKRRDVRVVKALWRRGWHVIRVWEHSLRPNALESTAERLLRCLRANLHKGVSTGYRSRRADARCAVNGCLGGTHFCEDAHVRIR